MTFRKSLLIFLLVFALGLFLRCYKLGNQSFIADENIGIEIGYGYSQSGEWKFWDFNRDQLTDQDYTRAKVYYWQIAQVFKFLKPTEANSRLVSVAWGMLGVIIIFFITYYFTRKPLLALTTCLLLAVSISALMYDRKLRMYSMFSPIYFLFSISIYQFLESIYQGKMNWLKKINCKTGLNWVYFIPIILLGWLALQTHLLTVNIFPVAVVFILTLAIYEWIKNKKVFNNKYLWLSIIMFLIVAGMFKTQYFKDALTFFNFVNHWGYLEKITLDYSYILIAGFFILLGSYYLVKKYKKFGLWIVISFFVTLASAIFIWDRVEGDQYIYLIEHFKVILYASGVYFLSLKLVNHKVIKWNKKYVWPVLILFFIFISVNLPFFFSADSFYFDIKDWNHSNHREAHFYIKNNFGKNEILISRSATNFYLWKWHIPTIDYGVSKKLNSNDIKQVQEKYDGIWLTYSKDTDIEKEAQDYIKKNFRLREDEYTNNNVLIWHWRKNKSNQ